MDNETKKVLCELLKEYHLSAVIKALIFLDEEKHKQDLIKNYEEND